FPFVMTQQWPPPVLNTVPSSTISPSASRNAPYRAWPTSRPSASLLNTRWAARRASGPRRSHLFSGETSHTATSSRMAAYSFPRAPNPSSQSHPPSAMWVPPSRPPPSGMCVPPLASVTSGNAFLIASSSPIACLRSPGSSHPPTRLTDRSSSPKGRPDRECRGLEAGQAQEAPRGTEPPFLQPGRQHEEELGRDHRVVERLVGARHRDPVPLGGRRQALSNVLIQVLELDRHLSDVDRPAHPRAGASAVEATQEADLDAREPGQEEPPAQRESERLPGHRERLRVRQILGQDAVDPHRLRTRGHCGQYQLVHRLPHDDAALAHRNDPERHDRAALSVEARRLEVERDELHLAPRTRPHRPRRLGGWPQRHLITSVSVTTPSMRRSIAPIGTRSTICSANAIAIAATPSRRLSRRRS